MKIHFLMPATPLSIFLKQAAQAETPVKCDKYPECETCINREFDPFACEDCEDGSNYEPEDDDDYEDTDSEDMNITEFKQYWESNSYE